jgi:hypothetical protein
LTKRVGDVFIAGGQPQITYNPRRTHRLEEQLTDYLATGYKLLSITGPTKCGKTVLCRRVIPTKRGVWIQGGQIHNESDFWISILDRLGRPTNFTQESGTEYSQTSTSGMNGGLNLGIANTSGRVDNSETDRTSSRVSEQYIRNPRMVAIDALIETNLPLIIDDFHYISREIQAHIVRALKDPIFEGLRVIVIAVPHRAFDAVRVETEMTGRVAQLQIPLWTYEELREIPAKGFPELNASCPEPTIEQFTRESFGSPHLIQEFCLKLCYDNGLRETKDQLTFILEPGDYSGFFREVALSTSRVAFERLARGPRQRTDRVERQFTDGTSGDIYLAILKAIAHTGPKTDIQYEELRTALREVIVGQLPGAHEVTRVLAKMSEIAREQIEGEPVIEWMRDTLHIADPFFAFYLKWYA